MHFKEVIDKYRILSHSTREQGDRFEKLMVAFLKTYPQYETKIKHVWQWKDFPHKADIGLRDTGIDLVAVTDEGSFWAVQCKCYQENTYIDKDGLNSFISTSSKIFTGQDGQKTNFELRLFISTSNNWSSVAENIVRGQKPPFQRITLAHLESAPVDWKKLDSGIYGPKARTEKKEPREHQKEAVDAFHEYFKSQDRGKLILPCGTGKTYTALKIAEKETGGKGLVVFAAPSIALVGQTLREWTADSEAPLFSICVCSDAEISKKFTRSHEDDSSYVDVENLAMPASTSPEVIAYQLKVAKRDHPDQLCVIFSTYHSLAIVAKAVSDTKSKIDLMVCDEAHRTTGVTLANEDESHFVKVQDQSFLPDKKRLYMTATPRIYGELAKKKAEEYSAVICSMDDPNIYGAEVYRMGFSQAVKENLLSDYKVLVLTVKQSFNVPEELKKQIEEGKKELEASDPYKFIGC
ncbi:MAG: DEAD/DEAH box helicase family protein, partial [Deltaproteobacteria bacterium]|nr:DEAD/DEAH box helicase family protein [Deltaproteobacteria bacterium]